MSGAIRRHIHCAAVWLSATLVLDLAAGPNGVHTLWIDGANGIVYDQQRPYEAQYTGSPIRGTTRDSFPTATFLPFFEADTQALAFLSGRLGSETGDPLLNKYLYTDLPNRDHYSKEIVAVRIPPLSTLIYGAYRYTDHHSDYFDRQWSAYAGTRGRPMEHMNIGLNEEERGGYLIRTPAVSAQGHLFRYNNWAPTPYFFSPLFFRGIHSRHCLTVRLPRTRLHGKFLIDNQQRFSDHHRADRTLYYATEAGWEQTLLTDTRLRAGMTYDNRWEPATGASLSLTDTTVGPLSFTARGGAYDNLQGHGSMHLGVRPIMPLMAGFELAHLYRPRQEPYWFLQLQDTVRFIPAAHRATTVRATLAYHDTLLFPLRCETWYDYHNAPLWERVIDREGAPTRIEQVTGPAALATAGGLISCTVERGSLAAKFWANGHTVVAGKEPLSVPWNAGMELRWGRFEEDRLSAGLRLEATGSTTQRYLSSTPNTGLSSTAASRVTLEGICKVPFCPPLVHRFFKAYAVMRGGPLQLSGKPRIRNHPKGNAFGPAVSFQLIALLSPRETRGTKNSEAEAAARSGHQLPPR